MPRIVFPIDKLPETTIKVLDTFIRFTKEANPSARHLFASAYLGSHFCIQEFPEPTAALLTPSRVRETLAEPNIPLLRMVLLCGAALESALLSPYITRVRFMVGGTPDELRVVQLNLDELPAAFGFTSQKVSGETRTCEMGAVVGCRWQAIHRGTMWMFGRAPAIDAITNALSGSTTVAGSVVAAALEALPPLSLRFVSRTAGTPGKTLADALRDMDEYADAPNPALPKNIEQALDAMAPGVEASGYALNFAGSQQPAADEINGSYTLVARSEGAAPEIQRAFESIVEDWKRADMSSSAIGSGLRRARVQSHGRVISLSLRQPLTANERAEDELSRPRVEEQKASIVRIFAAIEKGEPIPSADVERLAVLQSNH